MRGTALHIPRGAPVRARRATWRDLDALDRFVARYATDGALLPRTREDLAGHLEGFRILSDRGTILGCGALHRFDGTLAEIRTLVVAPAHRGAGLGSRLVESLLRQARREGIESVFCLTRRPTFFARLGFEVAPHGDFPEKIWRDCRHCPLRMRCDEIAMRRALGSRPRLRPVPA